MAKKCPSCNSSKIWNYGKRKDGVPQFKCGACRRQFTDKTGSAWARFRTDGKSIVSALAIRFVGRSSLRAGKFLLDFALGVGRSHVSIYNWEKKFAPKFELVHSNYKKHYGKTWRIDEIFVKTKGAKSEFRNAYVYILSDQKGNILATHVSNERDAAAVETVIAKVKDAEAKEPDFVVTDEHKSCPEPIRFNLPGAKHVQTGFEPKRVQRHLKKYRFGVNPHERLNGDVRAFLYGRRGFKDFGAANRTMDMYRIQQVAKNQGKQEWFWNGLLGLK